ncbi:hypothetical protein JYU02_00360 [bacterium AH-315-P15]|nr:hypothetical protein [bacterium AH-315-P15]
MDRIWTAFLAAGFSVALVFGAAGPALAERGTVIASTSDNYPVGTALSDGANLSLAEGASVSVLTISSRVIEVAGPFEGLVPSGNAASSSFAETLTAAVFQTDEGSPELGGVRGIKDLKPSMILPGTVVNTGIGGPTCVREGAIFGLNRTIPEGQIGDWTYGELNSSAAYAQVRWSSLEYNVLWPEELAYGDGDQFTIHMAGAPAPVSFAIHVLPATDSPGELLNWMAERGCVAQIQSVVAEMQSN